MLRATQLPPLRKSRVVNILGSQIDVVDADEAAAMVQDWIEQWDGTCRQVVCSGFHAIWEAHRDAAYKQMVNTAELWLPDGIAPVWLARLRGIPITGRVPGPEFMEAVLAKADLMGYRSFFYGDTPETLATLTRAIQSRYPGHRVVGALSPPFRPFTPEEDEAHIQAINEAAPDILWVGLGTPKQDRWIYEHRDRLSVPVAIGVGAAFRFLTGQVPRAPEWMGRVGCEWAFRLAVEPRKCWRRVLIQGPQFMTHALLELLGLRKYK